jgi:hypothetical protein
MKLTKKIFTAPLLGLTVIASAPFIAATTATANAETSTGTLHIITKVINTYAGTMKPSDFNVIIKSSGIAVSLSPVPGMGGNGYQLALAPGKYSLSQLATPGYRGVWSGNINTVGQVTIIANTDVVVTRTDYDMYSTMPKAVTTIPAVTPPVPVDTPTDPASQPDGTVSGGTLPATATPWGNNLVIGGSIFLLGAVGFVSRRRLLARQK